MSLERLLPVLAEIGVNHVGPESRLRRDLALDSTETTELDLMLAKSLGVAVDLWGPHDYSVGELADLIDGKSVSAAATNARRPSETFEILSIDDLEEK